jgi:hypothetical protein
MMCTFDIAKTALFGEQLTSCAYVQARLVKIMARIDGCARYKHELVEGSLSFVKETWGPTNISPTLNFGGHLGNSGSSHFESLCPRLYLDKADRDSFVELTIHKVAWLHTT